MTKPVLVLAASGTIGSKIVASLVAKGISVRAATRAGTPVNGAHAVAFDYADGSTHAAALDGAGAVFVVTPAGNLDPVGLLKPVITAAIARGIKVVLMTALGVDADDSIPYRQVEIMLEKSGAPYVILRPNWFADNFHTYWIAGVRHGALRLPAAEGKTSFIDARDIAESAAEALTTDAFNGKAFNLTGPDAFDYAEAAAILSKVTGKAIAYQAVDDDTFVSILTGAGMPEAYARFMASIYYPVRQGWAAGISDGVATLTGKPPRSLETYAKDHAAALAS